jgi:hypothetical protein
MKLLHGTTRFRAERIVESGPDARYQEPGGRPCEEGFSMYLESGPFHFGSPTRYALGKAAGFPDEGGAAIVEVEVLDEIVERATGPFFPLSQGIVQFDRGSGMEELLAAWPNLSKRIILL